MQQSVKEALGVCCMNNSNKYSVTTILANVTFPHFMAWHVENAICGEEGS